MRSISILLGATSGALAGSAGAGLVSVLAALGMPEEQAAWAKVQAQFDEDENGVWSKAKVSV